MFLIRYMNKNYYAYNNRTSLPSALLLSLLSYVAVFSIVYIMIENTIEDSDFYRKLNRKFMEE